MIEEINSVKLPSCLMKCVDFYEETMEKAILKEEMVNTSVHSNK